MPIKLGRDCRIYWNYQVHELPKGTVVPEGEFADYLRSTGDPSLEDLGPDEPKRRTRRTDS